MSTLNAAALLLERAADDHVALVCGSRQMTYRELRAAVAHAGAVWRGLGVAPGERIVIGLPDGLDAVVAYLGAMWVGAVAMAVNPRITAAQWQGLARQSDARRLLVDDTEDVPTPVRALALALPEWRTLVRAAAPVPALALAPEAPAAWSHSSGTAGTPKAVVHGHRFALGVERVAAEILGIGPGDRLFATSRLFFVYPLANCLFAGLRIGASVVLDAARPGPAMVLRVVGQERPTVIFAVPSLLRDLLHHGQAKALKTHGVRLVVSAGEDLPGTLRAAWDHETGIPLVNGYGASETLGLVLVDRGDGLRPAPGVEIGWADFDHDPTLPGRIVIDAPTLALGYWQLPHEQAEHFRADGFCPSDLFEHLPGGIWRFGGREDSLVKIRSRWVDLAALAEWVSVHPAVAGRLGETAAVAVPDADGLSAIALFYVARPGAHAEARAALDRCLTELPTHQQPRWLHGVPEFPRTATGKLLRRQLQQMHEVLKRGAARA